MAGLHPNPHINCPIPTVTYESAIHIHRIPIISNPHEVRIAILRPQLSETYGIKKKPIIEPAYKSDYSIGRKY